MERFAALLPNLLAQNSTRRLQRADLRYTNGFALTWAAPEPAHTNTSGAAGTQPPRSAASPTSHHGSNT
jgi:cell division protein FtsQ